MILAAVEAMGRRWALVPLAALLSMAAGRAAANPAGWSEIQPILERHCVMCHSATPTHEGYPHAANGVTYDTPLQVQRRAASIRQRVVVARDMPLNNETHMTAAERELVRRWVDAGAPIP